MKPGFGLNNNSKVTDDKKKFFYESDDYFECEKMKDYTEEVGKQSGDGWLSKPQYKCLYCGKGFEDVVLRSSHEQLCTCYSYLNPPPPPQPTLTISSTAGAPVFRLSKDLRKKVPMSAKEKELTAANAATKWWGNMSQSELSSKSTQQSSELPNISKCCHMIKTALGALNDKKGSYKKVIKKYIRQKFQLNLAFVPGKFETKISTALRRMLATKEIVHANGLYKLNSDGNEAKNEHNNKFDSLIWTAANALDNENGFSRQDIQKYLQDTNRVWKGGFQLCSKSERTSFNKAMAFMVNCGLINLVRGVLGTQSAIFELAKTHTSEENEKTNDET